METFINTYGLDFATFRQKAVEAELYMAGSSALALYLKEKGVQSEYAPGDIDLYFRGETNTKIIRDYILENGYRDSQKFTSATESPYADACIQSVDSYTNDKQQEIQLITLTDTHNILEYIACQFDLSVCATWWAPSENEFKTFDEKNTIQKNMYFMKQYLENHRLVGMLTAKQTDRLTKYTHRGFIIQPRLVSSVWLRDDREQITCCLSESSGIKNKTAFDIWEYDDINCVVFLKQNDTNIILKIKDMLYAFNRQNLYDYMSKRYCMITRNNYVYQTPMNQCISKVGLNLFLYSTLTIFELTDEHSIVDHRGEPKSAYRLNAFSTEQWLINNKHPSMSSPCIVEMELDQMPESSPLLVRSDTTAVNYDEDLLLDDTMLEDSFNIEEFEREEAQYEREEYQREEDAREEYYYHRRGF